VAWAQKYRVVVFAVAVPGAGIDDETRQAVGDNLPAMPEAGPEAHRKPVLSAEIAAGALSWTPSVSQGLAEGVDYAWCVGALDANGAWTWSELMRFRIDIGARQALGDNDQDGLKEKKEEPTAAAAASASMEKDTGGRDMPVDPASPMGTEGTYSTFYGTGAGANNSADSNANSFFGANAGYFNNTGYHNSFMGRWAGYSNSTGNRNTFLGYQAGYNNITHYNTFIGCMAGFSNTTGTENTFIADYSGYLNTSGGGNTFMGRSSGYNNTFGYDNTFIGKYAGFSNTTGYQNTVMGINAGYSNTTGNENTFMGINAGYSNTTGYENTFMGKNAGYSNTTGDSNTFLGMHAGYYNTEGIDNTFIGPYAGYRNTSSYNAFIGRSAGANTTTGDTNTFMGSWAGYSNTTGYRNTFMGSWAGYSTTTGYGNTNMGIESGYYNTTGYGNTFLGLRAGYLNQIGSNNVFLGFHAGYNETGSNMLYIDNSDTSSPLIYGDFSTDLLKVNGALHVTGGFSLDSGATSISSSEINILDGKTLATGAAGNKMLVTKGYVDESDDVGGGLTGSDMSEGYLCKWDDTNSRLVDSLLSETAGAVGINGKLGIGTAVPASNLDLRSTGSNNVLAVTRTDGATFKLSAMGASGQLGTVSSHPVNIMTSNVKRLTVAVSGNVGIGVTVPAYPLHMASGAHCTVGGVWTNASSLALKENIASLSPERAAAALQELRPVTYNYKAEKAEECVGFIAEEVPELVAQNDRKGLSPMDIVAVLTRVVQEQQEEISLLKARLSALERKATENK
jgi:hypothetical protein